MRPDLLSRRGPAGRSTAVCAPRLGAPATVPGQLAPDLLRAGSQLTLGITAGLARDSAPSNPGSGCRGDAMLPFEPTRPAHGPALPALRRGVTALPSTALTKGGESPREGWDDVYIPTLPDARTGHRKWGVAPSHGLKARFGIDESGGRGPTVMPSATCGISRVSRPRAVFVSGTPLHQIHTSRSASGRAGFPIRPPSPRAAPSPMLPPGATAPGRTAGEPDS